MAVRGVLGTGGSSVTPTSVAGRWSAGLFVLFAVAIAVFVTITSMGAGTFEADFLANLEATIPLLVAALAALGSLTTGVLAMFRAGDRSAAVVLATGTSGMVTFFVVGELLSVIGLLPQH